MDFWQRFYKVCVENHISPNKVGEKLNITSGTITGWKKGSSPNADRLKAIAEFFGVSCDYLLGLEDQIPSDLPADEAELLQDYRKASEEDKNMIRTLAKGAAQKQIPAEETA